MRFGYICKLIVVITTMSLFATLPAGGKAESDEHCIKIKISEISYFENCNYAVISADCNGLECSGFSLVLCSDGGIADTDNLCPDACITAACSDDKCALVWDFDKCRDYDGFIAKIKFTGNIRIVKADVWTDSGRASVCFNNRAENIYEVSTLCEGLRQVTQYKKYGHDEMIDELSGKGCFMSDYGKDYITVGVKIPILENLPEAPISDFLKQYKTGCNYSCCNN